MGYKGSSHTRRQQSSQKRPTSTSGRMAMAHPCDGKVWKQFDQDYKGFAADPRNIRLSVTVKASPSSDWEVFLNVLNGPPGPPGTEVNSEDMHPTLIIPGPKVPKKLDALIEPLLDELLEMWEGIETWDASTRRYFKMRAAVLWLHDFPDYSDLSGWCKRGTVSADISGSSGPTSSPKVQKHSHDYSVAVSAEHQINDGLPHGRLSIGGGAVSEAFTEALKLDTPPPPEILQGGAPAQVVVDGTDSSHVYPLSNEHDTTDDGENCNIDSRSRQQRM